MHNLLAFYALQFMKKRKTCHPKFSNYEGYSGAEVCLWQHQNAPPPSLHKKATAPSPTSPHMYERKQSCIKLGDLLPLGRLTTESYFIQFLVPLSETSN